MLRTWTIRDFSEDDYAGVVEVYNAITPDMPTTVGEYVDGRHAPLEAVGYEQVEQNLLQAAAVQTGIEQAVFDLFEEFDVVQFQLVVDSPGFQPAYLLPKSPNQR